MNFLSKIDEDDDLMSVEEFVSACDDGCFCDDGFGYVSNGTHTASYTVDENTDIRHLVSENPDITHVVWYNK